MSTALSADVIIGAKTKDHADPGRGDEKVAGNLYRDVPMMAAMAFKGMGTAMSSRNLVCKKGRSMICVLQSDR